jgi:hypothetical protein
LLISGAVAFGLQPFFYALILPLEDSARKKAPNIFDRSKLSKHQKCLDNPNYDKLWLYIIKLSSERSNVRIFTIICILLFSIPFCGCASFTPYNTNEKQWLVGMWAACGADAYQFQQIDESSKFEEGNSIVAKNPEFSLIGVPLILTVGGLWMEPKERIIWFKTFAGVKSAAVAYNYEQGVR